MSEYTNNVNDFTKELALYFENTHSANNTLTVTYQDQRNCVFLEINEQPSSDTFLPDNAPTGYILYNNQMYFLDVKARTCELLNTKSASDIDAFKAQVNYKDSPILLAESQLAYASQITNHPRKTDFLSISLVDEKLQWSFADEEKIRGDENTLHPVLGALYGTLRAFNQNKSPKKMAPVSQEDLSKGTYQFKMPKKTWWQLITTPFSWVVYALKTAIRLLLVDNFVFKYTIGAIVVAIANYGNPHYRTEKGTLSDILGRLIFPGGLKKPIINPDYTITLDPVLSHQFDALRRAEDHRDIDTGHFVYDDIAFEEFPILMSDSTVVAGVRAQNALVKEDGRPNNRVYVIAFNGNSGTYQDEMFFDAHALKDYEKKGLPVELIRFNYPGVINSNGRPNGPDALVTAGIAQVERLLAKGVKPENIQLQGISLGGSISSHVASFYHKRNQTLGGLCVSITFSSTTNVAISYVNKVPYVGPILGVILRPFIAFGLWTRWQLDTAKHFASLPDNKAWYTVARTPQIIQNQYAQEGRAILDDTILNYSTSLHNSWRIQLKHRLAKFFGLFGYNKEKYKEMNTAHKLVIAVDEVMSHAHCAHADVRPFGLIKKGSKDESNPKLFVRSKEATDSPVIRQ